MYMNTDFLLTALGERVAVPRNIALMCTARHPITNEMVILSTPAPEYLFAQCEAPSVYAASSNDEPHDRLLEPVKVRTELVLVNRKFN